jgi:general secretion pathway protein F
MGAYEYRALDPRGRQIRGVATGDTARQVRQSLRDKGLSPLDINAVAESGGSQRRASSRKINPTQLAVITRQFATLVGSGMTIEGIVVRAYRTI